MRYILFLGIFFVVLSASYNPFFQENKTVNTEIKTIKKVIVKRHKRKNIDIVYYPG